MEFEKLQEIIAEVLNIEPEDVTMAATFVDDLGADSLDIFRSSWELKRSSTLRFQMKLQNRSLPLGTQLNRLKMH